MRYYKLNYLKVYLSVVYQVLLITTSIYRYTRYTILPNYYLVVPQSEYTAGQSARGRSQDSQIDSQLLPGL